MKCPECATDLKMAERQGVEIDYCPQCRGVWLDRGELDKIIERSASSSTESRRDDEEGYSPFGWRKEKRDEHYDERRKYGDDYDPRRRKKKSFLGDLFDFD